MYCVKKGQQRNFQDIRSGTKAELGESWNYGKRSVPRVFIQKICILVRTWPSLQWVQLHTV